MFSPLIHQLAVLLGHYKVSENLYFTNSFEDRFTHWPGYLSGAGSFTTALEKLEKVLAWFCAFRGTQEHHEQKAPETPLRFICPLRDLITKSAQALALPANPVLLLEQELYKGNVSTVPGFATTYFFSTKTKFRDKVDIGHMSSGRTLMRCVVSYVICMMHWLSAGRGVHWEMLATDITQCYQIKREKVPLSANVRSMLSELKCWEELKHVDKKEEILESFQSQKW